MKYLEINIRIVPFDIKAWGFAVHRLTYIKRMYGLSICFGPINLDMEWEMNYDK